jgi:hypothetical protein
VRIFAEAFEWLSRMNLDKSLIQSLVDSPSESLNIEIKRWIDPVTNAGIEKIVKGALALRNRNGGFLVTGFDNKTLAPDREHEPVNTKELFHIDVIQGIISKYSSDAFEIDVAWGDRDGISYPIIVVPPGVKVPVAAKRDLKDGDNFAIKMGSVYFRTLAANGTPSSAEAKPVDWQDIVEICFDNREADVGRFIRRHLSGPNLGSALAQITQQTSPKSPPTLRDRTEDLLEDGEKSFQLAIESRSLSEGERKQLAFGFWSVALIIDPPHSDAIPDQRFSSIIASSNPNYTGWPVWLDVTGTDNLDNLPKVKNRAVESLIISELVSTHIDFARWNPIGEFYLHRLMQDDGVSRMVEPGTSLDPCLATQRVAEAIAIGIAYAKALDWQLDATTLNFAFKWTRLSGRQLIRWSDPFSTLPGGTAFDDTVTTFTELLSDTPLSAISPFVEQATRDLFLIFNGVTIPPETTEDWVRRLIERRLRG